MENKPLALSPSRARERRDARWNGWLRKPFLLHAAGHCIARDPIHRRPPAPAAAAGQSGDTRWNGRLQKSFMRAAISNPSPPFLVRRASPRCANHSLPFCSRQSRICGVQSSGPHSLHVFLPHPHTHIDIHTHGSSEFCFARTGIGSIHFWSHIARKQRYLRGGHSDPGEWLDGGCVASAARARCHPIQNHPSPREFELSPNH